MTNQEQVKILDRAIEWLKARLEYLEGEIRMVEGALDYAKGYCGHQQYIEQWEDMLNSRKQERKDTYALLEAYNAEAEVLEGGQA